MKSHEALRQAIGGATKFIAQALHVSPILVYKWQEPSGGWPNSGKRNPLDTIRIIVETSLKLGRNKEDAFAPIHYLAREFGLIVIEAPEAGGQLRELQQELMRSIKEFSDLMNTSSKALEDGKLQPYEAEEILKEGWELIEQVMKYLKKVSQYRESNE